jgi:hypothetical protein
MTPQELNRRLGTLKAMSLLYPGRRVVFAPSAVDVSADVELPEVVADGSKVVDREVRPGFWALLCQWLYGR